MYVCYNDVYTKLLWRKISVSLVVSLWSKLSIYLN